MMYLSILCRVASHYNDVIIGAMASQFSSLAIVYPRVYSSADQRKYQRSASLAFVRGINRWPVNSPHKWPVTRKTFPFDDVIIPMLDDQIRIYCLTWQCSPSINSMAADALAAFWIPTFFIHIKKHNSIDSLHKGSAKESFLFSSL